MKYYINANAKETRMIVMNEEQIKDDRYADIQWIEIGCFETFFDAFEIAQDYFD